MMNLDFLKRLALTFLLPFILIVPLPAFPQNDTPYNNTIPQQEDTNPEAYVDQVIEESDLSTYYDQGWGEKKGIFPDWGPGSMGITYRYYGENFNHKDSIEEHAVELRWNQETIQNGNFSLQMDGLKSDFFADEEFKGGRFLYSLRDYIVNPEIMLNGNIGHFRSYTPQLISQSYRVSLPTTLLQGFNTGLYSKNSSLSFDAGNIGVYRGTATQAFDKTQGRMNGLGFTHRFDHQWHLGTQVWQTIDPEIGDSHQSIAAVLQHNRPAAEQNHQLNTLVDSFGNVGTWYDNQFRLSRWGHRTGFYFLEPELSWTNETILNDRAGLFWRGDYQSMRWHWSLGSELLKSNIYEDASNPGYIHTASYANTNWRFRRKTHLGFSSSLDTKTADSGTADDDKYYTKFKPYIGHQFNMGYGRIEPGIEFFDEDGNQTTRYGILWDQYWKVLYLDRLNSDLQYLETDKGNNEVRLQLMLGKLFWNNINISGSAQYIVTNDRDLGQTKGSSFIFDASWQFHRNWMMSFNLDYNHNLIEPDNSTATYTIEDNKVLFSISYIVDTGNRKTLYGIDTDQEGIGRITGRVFYDSNQNGKFDIDEKAARNILVYIDQGFSVETGPQGRYEFWPVKTGDHTLALGVEDVPLPWGLYDDTPVRVSVPIRQNVEVDFPLTRLNQ